MTPWTVTAVRAAARARALLVQLRRGAAGDSVGAIPADDVEVLQPLGLRVRPLAPDPDHCALEAFVVEQSNGDRVALVLVDKSTAAGDVSPEAGATLLHGLAERSAVVYIRASGDIELTPKSGRSVILAGGEARAAREGHAVSATTGPGSMSTWITAVTTAINALTAPGTVTAPTTFGRISEGADHVRVP